MYSSIDPWGGIDIHDCVKRKCDQLTVVSFYILVLERNRFFILHHSNLGHQPT